MRGERLTPQSISCEARLRAELPSSDLRGPSGPRLLPLVPLSVEQQVHAVPEVGDV